MTPQAFLSPLVLQEGFNLIMRSAKVEDEGLSLALEDKPQIQSTAAFHERLDASQPHPSMQVGLAIHFIRSLHRCENHIPAISRDAFEKARSRQQLHGARSVDPVISRSLPARRAHAVSLRMATPALTLCAKASRYSDAK